MSDTEPENIEGAHNNLVIDLPKPTPSDNEPETSDDETSSDEDRTQREEDKENVDGQILTRGRGRPRKSEQEGLKDKPADDAALKQAKKLEDDKKKLNDAAQKLKKCEDEKKKLSDNLKKQDDEKKKLKQALKKAQDSDTKSKVEVNRLKDKLDDALKDVKSLSDHLVSTQSTLKDRDDELDELNKLVIEKEQEISDLMSQLVKVNAPSKIPLLRPKGLIIVDDVSRPIAGHLSQRVDWTIANDSDWSSQACGADLCVIIYGAQKIISGNSSVDMFGPIRDLINDKTNNCKMIVVSVPVHKQRPHGLQLKLLNYQLKELAKECSDSFKLINPTAPREDLYHHENGLTENAVSLWANTINSEMEIPSAQPRPSSSKATNAPVSSIDDTFSTSLIVEVPKEAVGAIIGKNGYNIRDMTSNFGVKMAVGKWFEKTRGTSQAYSERSDAVVITGEFAKAQKSAAKIRQLATESNNKPSSDEPESKKFKF